MSRPRILAATLLAAGIFAGLLYAFGIGFHRRTLKLKDGNTLALASITTGSNHFFRSEPRLLEEIRERIPQAHRRWLGKPGQALGLSDCPPGTTALWAVRRSAIPNLRLPPGRPILRIIGAGQERFDTQLRVSTGSTSGDNEILGLQLPVFPRREPKVRVEVLDGAESHTLELGNPYANTVFPQWRPEALPATRTSNGLSVTVQSLESRPAPDGTGGFRVAFSAEWDGRSCDGGCEVEWEAEDPTGNRSGTRLPASEPVWRLHGRFRPGVLAQLGADWVQPLGQFESIQPGGVVSLATGAMAPKGVRLATLLGPGAYRLTNGTILPSAGPGDAPQEAAKMVSGTNGWEVRLNILRPRLVVICEGLPDSSSLLAKDLAHRTPVLARLRDASGRMWPGQPAQDETWHLKGGLVRVLGWQFRNPEELRNGTVELIEARATDLEFTVAAPHSAGAH